MRGPLLGVSVRVEGSQLSTVTDNRGSYTIQVSARNAVLEFSSVGYVNQSVTVGQRRNIDVVMEEDMSALDEVVVVGYGTQKKVNLTGSVSSVSGEDIAK